LKSKLYIRRPQDTRGRQLYRRRRNHCCGRWRWSFRCRPCRQWWCRCRSCGSSRDAECLRRSPIECTAEGGRGEQGLQL